MLTPSRITLVLVTSAVLAGLAGCAPSASGSSSDTDTGADSGTQSQAAAPSTECPAGVDDAAAQGLKDFELYQDVQVKPASASDTPLDAVAQNISGALCVVGFTGTNGASSEGGTVAFLPVAGKDAVVAALENIGYTNELQEYTFTEGGQITSSEIANVTITPADYWSVDFTPLFSQPIVVVTTTKG